MPRRISSPVLIGRAEELGRLDAAFEGAAAGDGRLVLIAGEAGVGKTRLVRSWQETAAARGARCLVGGCLPLGGQVPHAPLIELLRDLRNELGADGLEALPGARAVLDVLYTPAPADGQPVGASAIAPLAQLRLLDGVATMLGVLGTSAPVVVAFEDLHWADGSTRDLIVFLARHVTRARVLVLATLRTDDTPPGHPLERALVELRRQDLSEWLELRPFTHQETAAQLEAILGVGVRPETIDEVLARSGGNPFYTEELAAAGLRDALPSTLRDVLRTRIERLPVSARLALTAAAAAGGPVSYDIVLAASGLSQAELDAELRTLLAHQLLVAEGARYTFRHALAREALYADTAPGERRRLHAAMARFLAARPPSAGDAAAHALEVAHHWHEADEPAQALEAAVRAAAAAETVHAPDSAQAQFERALDLWGRVAAAEALTGMDRAEVLGRAADAASMAGADRRARELVEAALAEIDPAADPVRVAVLLERLGRYAWLAGDARASFDAYLRAVDLMPAEPPTRGRARVLAALAQGEMLRCAYADAVGFARKAAAIAQAVGAPAEEGHARNTLGTSLVNLGCVEEGLGELERALQLAEQVGEPAELSRIYVNLPDSLLHAGRREEASRRAAEGWRVADEFGLARSHGSAIAANGVQAMERLGRWDEALQLGASATAVGPTRWGQVPLGLALARIELRRGRFEAADSLLTAAGDVLDGADDPQFGPWLARERAELALWRGRTGDARAAAAEGLRLMVGVQGPWLGPELCALAVRAEADDLEAQAPPASAAARARSADRAASLVERAERLVAGGPCAAPPEPAVFAVVARAEAARLADRPAAEPWVAAAAAAAAMGEPYLLAYARWREAETLLAEPGGRDRAREAIVAAAETARKLEAAPLLRQVELLASRARLPLERKPPPPPGAAHPAVRRLGLTQREAAVLELLTAGLSNRQIANRLFISERTAGVHVSNILGKLGVRSRLQAAAVAHRELGATESADA